VLVAIVPPLVQILIILGGVVPGVVEQGFTKVILDRVVITQQTASVRGASSPQRVWLPPGPLTLRPL
jgi:hypothetical protein